LRNQQNHLPHLQYNKIPCHILQARTYLNQRIEVGSTNNSDTLKVWRKGKYNTPVKWCGLFVWILADRCGVVTPKIRSGKASWYASKAEVTFQASDIMFGRYKPRVGDYIVFPNHIDMLDTVYANNMEGIRIGGNVNNAVTRRSWSVNTFLKKKLKFWITPVRYIKNDI